MNRRLRIGALGAALAAVAACGAGAPDHLQPDSPALAGLPQDVVQERLADPELLETVDSAPEGERVLMTQLNVSSTVFCRDVVTARDAWLLSGTRPQTPAVARPDHPEDGFDEFMDGWVSMVDDAVDSGDPDGLRD